jgi:hypothetical protein
MSNHEYRPGVSSPEHRDIAEWHAALQLAFYLQPWLDSSQLSRLVKDAARDVTQSNTSRRIAQHQRKEEQGAARQTRVKRKKWVLPDPYLFYGWVLLKSVAAWRSTERPLTNRLYTAAVVAAGIIGPGGGEQTAASLTASILDVLRRIPREQSGPFRDKLLDPEMKLANLDEAYSAPFRECISRISNLTKLAIDPKSGRKGVPMRIDGLNEVSGLEYDRFRSEEWPQIRMASIARNLHTSVYERDIPTDPQVFHALMCESCLETVAVKENWPRSVYLPYREGAHVIPINGAPDPDEARRVREEFQEEKRTRGAAAGRLMVSVDGAPAQPWKAGIKLKPDFSLELFRDRISVLWHEVDPPNSEELGEVSTTYKVGGRQYTFQQKPEGVSIEVEGEKRASRFGWLVSWLRTPTAAVPALAAVAATIALLFIPTSLKSVTPLRDGIAGGMGQKLNGSVEIQTWLPLTPWAEYQLEVKTPSHAPLTCAIVKSGWATATFQCGTELQTLDLMKVRYTLIEKRFGWTERRSQRD